MSLQIITKAMAQRNLASPKAQPRADVAPSDAKTDADTKTTPDTYQERLLKLIPTEVVSVYLALSLLLSNMSTDQDPHQGLHLVVFFILLVINILYKRNGGVTDWKQLVITSLAFIIWVLSLGGPLAKEFQLFGESSKTIGVILTPLFTMIVPLIYK